MDGEVITKGQDTLPIEQHHGRVSHGRRYGVGRARLVGDIEL